ncbi:MAG: hypothetical protein WC254_03000 [Candidatus Woesearchaeota archaeon]
MKIKNYIPYVLLIVIFFFGIILPSPTKYYVWIVGIVGITVLKQLL